MQTVMVSESAVAVLRFELRGWKAKDPRRRQAAYRELAAAGLMEPDGDGFRLTSEGRASGIEIVDREYERIERERYAPPDASGLSDAARGLLKICLAGGIPEGDEGNRPAFRELVRARIMIAAGSFTKGDEVVFRWTYWGWKRRIELAGL